MTNVDKSKPTHYGGADDVYEAIKVIQAWGLDFELGSVVKYISRAGKKPGESVIDDLRKARRYIDFAIAKCEKAVAQSARSEMEFAVRVIRELEDTTTAPVDTYAERSARAVRRLMEALGLTGVMSLEDVVDRTIHEIELYTSELKAIEQERDALKPGVRRAIQLLSAGFGLQNVTTLDAAVDQAILQYTMLSGEYDKLRAARVNESTQGFQQTLLDATKDALGDVRAERDVLAKRLEESQRDLKVVQQDRDGLERVANQLVADIDRIRIAAGATPTTHVDSLIAVIKLMVEDLAKFSKELTDISALCGGDYSVPTLEAVRRLATEYALAAANRKDTAQLDDRIRDATRRLADALGYMRKPMNLEEAIEWTIVTLNRLSRAYSNQLESTTVSKEEKADIIARLDRMEKAARAQMPYCDQCGDTGWIERDEQCKACRKLR